jgi:hypothetical protein
MRKIIIFLFIFFSLSSCLTGGFDENPQLDEREAALAQAPKVLSISVNGEVLQRDTRSRRVVEAKVGDQLNFSVQVSSGDNAELTQIEFARIYYFEDPDFEGDPTPVEPASDGFYPLSGSNAVFEYSYTVPELDDDEDPFTAGSVIMMYFRVKNSKDNFGFKAIEVHIID